MKKFQGTITVEVEINKIAEDFLSKLPEDYKHRELLTETVIGTTLSNGGIEFIYNALNGYDSEVDFKVGDIIFAKDEFYTYYDHETGIKDYSNRYPVVAQVLEVSPYKIGDKLRVKAITVDRVKTDGKDTYRVRESESWVSHLNCQTASMVSYDVNLDYAKALVAEQNSLGSNS